MAATSRFPRILGIDPGTNVSGFALLQGKTANPLHPRDYYVRDVGVLRADRTAPLHYRIGSLHLAMDSLLCEHKPDVCVLESIFVGQNVQSALKLGQVRGAFISAVSRSNIAIHEVSPASVKKTIAGHGQADKESIAHALKVILGFERGNLPLDATDALAIALAFALGVKASTSRM